MPEYTVYFSTTAGSPGVRVEADDPDEAIEKACNSNNLPSLGSICHQCAPKFDMGGDWEPTHVFDADDKQVWGEK